MKTHTVLGIDPGIANTGLTIVQGETRYQLVDTHHITTEANDALGERLNTIYEESISLLEATAVDAIAIERCFHNKNISSSATTQQVVGLIHWMSYIEEIPIIELTPQKIKSVCGLGGRAKKNEMLRVAKALLNHDFENHHLADAAFAGIAGILHLRTRRA